MMVRTIVLIGGQVLAVVVATAVMVAVVVSLAGGRRWRMKTDDLLRRLERGTHAGDSTGDAGRTGAAAAYGYSAPDNDGHDTASRYDPQTLATLPTPVQRYLETVLTPGQPIVSGVRITHSGMFNMSESGERWRPFRSTQRVVTDRPGFVWNGRVRVVPGVSACVHDAYVTGTGILHVAVMGLLTVVDVRETPEIARGELMRFLAEAAWYPTILLPGQGVTWSAVDDRSADATLTDGNISVTLRFRFGSDGLIEGVTADARDRTVGDTTEPTPWDGRFSNYQRHQGILVPMDGDVGWILADRRLSYWRGHIEAVTYRFR
jgi:hypothetical protein